MRTHLHDGRAWTSTSHAICPRCRLAPASRRGCALTCGRSPRFSGALRRTVWAFRQLSLLDDYDCRHRARAAAFAISRLRLGLSAAARAGPPLSPPSRPSAAACGLGSRARTRRVSTSTRSVGARQRLQGGPMTSVSSGSVCCSRKSQTRHRLCTVRMAAAGGD